MKWQTISDDHKSFNDKIEEVKSWIDALENKPEDIMNDEKLDVNKKLNMLQNLNDTTNNLLSKISLICSNGENLYPDTSAPGRDFIRNQISDIRNRYYSSNKL